MALREDTILTDHRAPAVIHPHQMLRDMALIRVIMDTDLAARHLVLGAPCVVLLQARCRWMLLRTTEPNLARPLK